MSYLWGAFRETLANKNGQCVKIDSIGLIELERHESVSWVHWQGFDSHTQSIPSFLPIILVVSKGHAKKVQSLRTPYIT